MVSFAKYPSPLGTLLLSAEEGFLTGLWMETQVCPIREKIYREALPIFETVRAWLDRYFAGEAPPIDSIPLRPAGTAFQKQVWNTLLQIPYGETVTYGQIAKQISGNAMSAQAVGQAVGRNPISILIPCHRVVGGNGKLTGYSGRLDKKIWLLHHEGALQEEAP